MGHLAYACSSAGQRDRAIKLAIRVVEKRKATLGPTHEVTAGAMHQLAMICLNAGRFGEAIRWCEKTLEVTQDRDVWPVKTYAKALQRAGRLEEADCQLRRALEIARKFSGRRSRGWQVTLVQSILGQNLLLQRRYTEAELAARESLGYLEKETPDLWYRFHAMSMVGGALMGQRRYTEAEPLLVQGYEGMKQREAFINAGFEEWLTKAGERLVSFYEVTNQPEKAHAWREKLQASADRK
jgi:tetratricopeptide (TPR) repeat protein